jgi:Phosphoglycerate dehydrogenase and related dehydrogenases
VIRPSLLVLTSDALFPHFFSGESQKKLDEVTDWTRSSLREDSSALRGQIADADVLMTTWHTPFLTAEMLGPDPRLKLIAHCGGEVKSRFEEQIFDYVTITNAAEPMASGVAEMALALTLTLVRRIPAYASEMRDGVVRTNEEVSSGETLFGRKVGLVGFGRIGRAFAKLVSPSTCNSSSVTLCATRRDCAQGGSLVDLDDLVRSCSVIILAAALTTETKNLFDKRRLSLMADDSCLINVARGGVIDTESLLAELRGRPNNSSA